jgi:hypothetical protein
LRLERIVSKRADAPYAPANRGLWVKVKCLNREEFVVVGWTDPEGTRPYIGALLLAYYDLEGRLVYAGRVGSGINRAELARLWRILQPLATDKMPLDVRPPRSNRFGSPLVLSRVHWVRPELVAEVKFLTWTDDNLLRQVVYEGLRGQAGSRGAASRATSHGDRAANTQVNSSYDKPDDGRINADFGHSRNNDRPAQIDPNETSPAGQPQTTAGRASRRRTECSVPCKGQSRPYTESFPFLNMRFEEPERLVEGAGEGGQQVRC